jgi:hypothetical protein
MCRKILNRDCKRNIRFRKCVHNYRRVDFRARQPYAIQKLFLKGMRLQRPESFLLLRQKLKKSSQSHAHTKRLLDLNHVIFATAITLAYSSIEELQLAPRGSKENPTTKPDGTWNPKNLAELVMRLKSKKIDGSDPTIWTLRGPPTRIERKGRPLGGEKASWSKGRIRDKQVPIVDALRSASWIRSKITTPSFTSLLLGPGLGGGGEHRFRSTLWRRWLHLRGEKLDPVGEFSLFSPGSRSRVPK